MTERDPGHLPRVLAIDDSILLHRLIKAGLRRQRLELHCALSGAQGLELAQMLSPDLILLDIDLPDINGLDVLREIRRDIKLVDVPVIILSGKSESDVKVRALDLGAMDFVTKPFDLAEVQARVRSALRLRQLIQLLAQRAQIDGLSGLWNRSYFDRRLAEELHAAQRYDRAVSLIMCDIDHFKAINDTHGHATGDEVIERIAHVLSDNRMCDIACRYGGEEFAIILPDTGLRQAVHVAERIRAALHERDWNTREPLRVTASFGVSSTECIGQPTPVELVNSADVKLYEAKRDGRDRVVAAVPRTKLRATA